MRRNFMFWHVYQDCNFSCEFCKAVILKRRGEGPSEAFKRFNDLTFHDQILRLFDEELSQVGPWTIGITGGEPLMMPNLPYLSKELIQRGHRIRYNTNLSIPIEKNTEFLDANPPEAVEVFMVSIHPESHPRLDEILERARVLKGMGYRLIVRSVATPESLSTLPILDEVCREIGITFTPLALRDETKPEVYTPEEFVLVRSLMKGYPELLALYGGVNSEERVCHAGSRSLVMGTTDEVPWGVIKHCEHCQEPVLAMLNLSEPAIGPGIGDQLSKEPAPCPCPESMCRCPGIFEHDLVVGLEAEKRYEQMCCGATKPIWKRFERWARRKRIRFHSPPRYLPEIPTRLVSRAEKRRYRLAQKHIES
jgi:hypothetical protein